MALFQPPPPGKFALKGPSSDSSSSESVSYDYSGLDRAIGLQDALAKSSQDKYQQLYAGNVPGSVGSSRNIRGLLTQLREYAPDASEHRPFQLSSPLVRVASESSSSSGSSGGGEYAQEDDNDAPGMAPPQAANGPDLQRAFEQHQRQRQRNAKNNLFDNGAHDPEQIA